MKIIGQDDKVRQFSRRDGSLNRFLVDRTGTILWSSWVALEILWFIGLGTFTFFRRTEFATTLLPMISAIVFVLVTALLKHERHEGGGSSTTYEPPYHGY